MDSLNKTTSYKGVKLLNRNKYADALPSQQKNTSGQRKMKRLREEISNSLSELYDELPDEFSPKDK